MNGYERCMAAIKGQPVDRLPVDLHTFLMCAQDSGMGYDEFVRDGAAMARMQLALWREFGHDMLLVENGTAALAEALGCQVACRPDGPPVVEKPLIGEPEEIPGLKIPENFWDSPMLRANLEAVGRLREVLGDQAFVMGRGDQGPFSLASQLYGMERLLMELMDEEQTGNILKLVEFCTQACIQYQSRLLQAGAHGTSMGDSMAGPDVLSPSMYREFAMWAEEKVIHGIHGQGGIISLHICGNATPILRQLCGLGADILEIDEKTDLNKALWEARGKCALLGQISPTLLRNGRAAEIAAEVERTVETAGGQTATGLILGPGCALAGDTPKENVKLLVQRGL